MSEPLEACQIPGRGYSLFLPAKGQRDEYHQTAASTGHWGYVQQAILQLTNPGDTVLDLGANIGTVTIPVACAGRRVIAYELLPGNVQSLALAAGANGLSDLITVRAGAVWDQPGTAYFTGNSAWGWVGTAGEAVERIVIDEDLCDPSSVRAIKIDVEGCELRALKGMRRLLAAQHPHIVFEGNALTLASQQTNVVEIMGFLEELGYRVFRFGIHHVLTPWNADVQPSICVDYLATTLSTSAISNKLHRTIRPLTAREYAKTLAEGARHGEIHRAYIAGIADLLPPEIHNSTLCSAALTASVRESAGSSHVLTCRSGLGNPPPHDFQLQRTSRLRTLWDRYRSWAARRAA